MKRYLIILFCLIHTVAAKPPILPEAMEIMEEVEALYRDNKVDLYLEKVQKKRTLSEDELDTMREEIEAFFESDLFLETGAAYLTNLFSERELSDVLQAIEDYGVDFDEANNRATRKLERLLRKLDPYLYKYVRSRVIK